MPDKDWSKYKTGGTQTGQTPIGTLQTQEVQPTKDWSKYKTVSREKPEEIAGQKVKFTKTGHIDTRMYWKTPKWVLRFNKSIDEKITKQFAEKPASLLMKLLGAVTFAHPYEAIRDIKVEPEKYPTILSKLGHYLETVISPKVSPALRGGFARGELGERFTTGYAGTSPIFAFLPEKYRRAEYEKRVLGEGLPPTAFKVGEKVIDLNKLYGYIENIIEPTGWALAGVGKLARTPLIPITTKLKKTVAQAMMPQVKKNLVAKVMSEMVKKGEDATGIFNNILKQVGKENWDEASEIFLTQQYKGWKELALKVAKTEVPEKLTIVDFIQTKLSKSSYDAKVVNQLRKNFQRGYNQKIVNDLDSILAGNKLKSNSLELQNAYNYINTAFRLEGLKKGSAQKVIMTRTLDDLAKGLAPVENQLVDYLKKMYGLLESVETSKAFGYELDMKHVKNYVFNKYITTGKKQAFEWIDLSTRMKTKLGITKPIFTFERAMDVVEAERLGYKIASPYESIVARIGLHSEAVNYRGFLEALSEMYGETSKKIAKEKGYRIVNIAPKKFVKALKSTYFPDEIASYIEKGNEIIKLSNFQEKLLKVMSPITKVYKTIWTYSPRFLIRNFGGSHTQNAIYYGAMKVLNPKSQALVSKLALGSDDFIFKIGGQEMSAKLFRDLFDLMGVGAGWFTGEITDITKAVGVFKSMRLAGETVERQVRMFSLYTALNQGDDLIKSALVTKLLHFDYIDGLSQAEKVYLRTWIPFYSWYRFNAPLQLRFMIENPYRVSNIFKVWRELGIGTPEETPKWFDNYMYGKIGDLDLANNVQKYLNLDLPITQIR